ncbi:MAG: dTDP-4-dehydrorhamnose 3,5-epimerase family protein [Pyrinomonadaceae bacterium]
MIFHELAIAGAYVVEPDPHTDSRGFFARAFCAREFAARGLNTRVAQCSLSYNRGRGTVRGLHYQLPPAAEAKLVRCLRGAIFDVIVDLRPGSRTFGWNACVLLSQEGGRALYVPAMCAHGYQTLTGDVELYYQMSNFYAPDLARGVRFDDPSLAVEWPLPVADISERDRAWPLIEQSRHAAPRETERVARQARVLA